MYDPNDTLLRSMAGVAFALGLEDGKVHSAPRSSEWLMRRLRNDYSEEDYTWRIIHRKKLRQVYGAGFDISKIIKDHAKD